MSARFVGGLAGGFFLGLIGTAIVYVVAGSDEVQVPAEAIMANPGRDQGYVQGFESGYRDRLRSRRKSAALGGGLLGTAFLLVLVVSASQGQ